MGVKERDRRGERKHIVVKEVKLVSLRERRIEASLEFRQ